jgi:hypothetical protein
VFFFSDTKVPTKVKPMDEYNRKMSLYHGSITTLNVKAIVTSTDESLWKSNAGKMADSSFLK